MSKAWKPGDRLGPSSLELTLRRSVQAVAGTRDYYPVHHDPDFARESGAYGLFFNTMFLQAFVGMPVLELPKESKAKQPRLFEVRIYESHNEEMGRRKIDMFNSGEIQIMRDVELAPLLYGETLIGDNVPNLTYILSAPDMPAHRQHWEAFSAHPEWQRMRSMPKYQGTVSKIVNYFLVPTAFSQI